MRISCRSGTKEGATPPKTLLLTTFSLVKTNTEKTPLIKKYTLVIRNYSYLHPTIDGLLRYLHRLVY